MSDATVHVGNCFLCFGFSLLTFVVQRRVRRGATAVALCWILWVRGTALLSREAEAVRCVFLDAIEITKGTWREEEGKWSPESVRVSVRSTVFCSLMGQSDSDSITCERHLILMVFLKRRKKESNCRHFKLLQYIRNRIKVKNSRTNYACK